MCGIMFWLRRIDGSTCLVGSFASGLFAAGGMLRAVSTSGPRRVFISHTSELAEYPQSRPSVRWRVHLHGRATMKMEQV